MNTIDTQDGLPSTSQQSAKEQDKEPYFERKKIEKTPFTIITEEKGSYAICGDRRITEVYENKGTVEKLIKSKDWELLTNFISLAIEMILEEKKVS